MNELKAGGPSQTTPDSPQLNPDIYFLIQHFLSEGPLKRTLQTLNEEIHQHKILPKRIDWQNNEHERSIEDMQRQHPSIRPDFLYFLCKQASLHLNPNSTITPSLLSFSPKLKTADGVFINFRQYFNYVTKFKGISMQDAKSPFNLVNSIRGRETGGPLSRQKTITPRLYNGVQMQRLTIGHLSAVYCLLFDHSGRYVITGADDLLIKLWSAYTGRLIAVFRGASSEITDMAIDPENSLLAAGSIDRILRVWSLQSGAPIAVLTGHAGMITSVNFCPTPCWGNRYLISTSTDGSIAFWNYVLDGVDNKPEFRNTPVMYQEKLRPGQAQMICSSFSPGGTFLATGSADHHVRVYYMKGDEGPQRILETEAHTDRVDSIQWAHSGLRFLSGSKDGTAIIWWFERQQWKNLYLDMTEKLPNEQKKSESDAKKVRVTMVAWNRSDTWVVTALSDHSMKVWTASTGKLVRILTGHIDEVYVLEAHPHDEDVMLSTGHDGQLLIWDLSKGEILYKYLNTIEGQGYGAIFDAKWNPDGCIISASDSHGDILTFGFGSGSAMYQQLPKELFFHTDYRPLVRDQNNWVLDEQTQIPPHLMPPPFLVDIDGNPYPPMLQRLVPGRENCNVDQLIPNVIVENGGIQEVIQDVSHHIMGNSDEEDVRGSAGGSLRSQRIRQSTGDWQTDHNIVWKDNILLPPLVPSVLERANRMRKLFEDAEMKEYQRQLRIRPLMISTAGPSHGKMKERKKRARKRRSTPTRIVCSRIGDVDTSRYMILPLSDGSPVEESFSDWSEELSRPTRRRKKRNNNYKQSGTSSDNDEDDEEEEEEDEDDLTSNSAQSEDDSDNVSDRERSERKTRKNKKNNKIKSKPVKSTDHKSTKNNSVSSAFHDQPSTSGMASTSRGPKIKISEQYKLSEWLAETRPRKSPYYPQIHDEIVYFVQGHLLYIEAVKAKSAYEPNIKELPWVKGMPLRDREFCKVVGIRYEIKPPRLCCLKLALQDENRHLTGKTFTVKYHDMPDVLDFFVLKQCYLTALSRDWQSGDRFRCMIDDNWWIGEITAKSPASDLYPDSAFMCYEIQWTNGEQERMSPWDMEPIDENRLPEDETTASPVLANELWSILYKPEPTDWPNCERDTACKAIARGIAQVMELAIAEPFLVPVDINVYPTYALVVEYPVDLSTIQARFENNFYRRLASAEFDIKYIELNAVKFNEKNSVIVKHAKIITELCLQIAKNGNNVINIASLYHQLMNDFESPGEEEEEEEDVDVDEDVDITQPSTSRAVRYRPVRSWKSPDDWKVEASGLLELLWQTEDSVPFQEPVNKHKYPTYYHVIKRPMDLSTVKEKLQKNYYKEPKDFYSDMRLIFQNSRTFNTNKRSRIYVMTVRLSALFEEHMKKITSNWRTVKRRHRRLVSSSDESFDSNDKNTRTTKRSTSPAIRQTAENGLMERVTDTDSDNTPLDQLKNASRSNTCTESDNTLDRAPTLITAEDDMTLSSDKPEEETVNHVFDHTYPNNAPSSDENNPPPDEEQKCPFNLQEPSTSGVANSNRPNNNHLADKPKKLLSDDNSSDEDYTPQLQQSDSSSEESFKKGSKWKGKKPMKNRSETDDDTMPLRQVQAGLKRRKQLQDESSGDEFRPDETSSDSSPEQRTDKRNKKRLTDSEYSDDSYRKNNKKTRSRKLSFVVDEEDDEEATSSSSSDDDEEEDNLSNESDSAGTSKRPRLRRRKAKRTRAEQESTDEDEETNSRSRRKRNKVLASTSDAENRGNSSATYVESVSSRGRVRRITERAAAFLKKEKKSG